jgi:hypothetical protein
MSSRSDVVPKIWVQHLSTLQDSLPPVPVELVERRLKQEFGRPVEELFATWDRVPLATASIAQVHTATMKGTGQKVAVKVQHDGIDVLMTQDLLNTETIMSWVAYFESVDDDFHFECCFVSLWSKRSLCGQRGQFRLLVVGEVSFFFLWWGGQFCSSSVPPYRSAGRALCIFWAMG